MPLNKTLILHHLRGLSTVRKHQLVTQYSIDEVFERMISKQSLSEFSDYFGMPSEKWAASEISRCAELGIELIPWSSGHYPTLLREVADPPLVLYARGRRELLVDQLNIAIVGSRKPSVYGKQVTHYFANRLVRAGCCIVSGMALGVDCIAHEEALSADNGRTIGVLGCGIDRIYPPSNRQLFSQVINKGLLLSEFPLGADPLKHHFPRRNRIISGLSHGTLVTEARQKSGSLITARMAIEQGRSLFAVPSSVYSSSGIGANQLIAQGAQIATKATDIIDEILPQVDEAVAQRLQCQKKTSTRAVTLSESEQRVLHVLQSRVGSSVEVFAAELGLTVEQTLSRLTELELRGLLRRDRQGYYVAML